MRVISQSFYTRTEKNSSPKVAARPLFTRSHILLRRMIYIQKKDMAWKGILEAVRTYLLKMAKIRMDGRIRCKRGVRMLEAPVQVWHRAREMTDIRY